MKKLFKKLFYSGLSLLCLLWLTQCTSIPDTKEPMEELIQADLDFSRMSKDEGMKKAFLEFAAEEGILLRPNRKPIQGREEIRSYLDKIDDSGFTLTWEPYGGDLSISGDMGFTYGVYTYTQDTLSEQGTYTSVWKKESGGWKYVMDTGNSGLGN